MPAPRNNGNIQETFDWIEGIERSVQTHQHAGAGTYSTAIGDGSAAPALGDVSIGYMAKTEGESSLAVGAGAMSKLANTVAIGANTFAWGADSTAIGANSVVNATSPRSIAIGKQASVGSTTPDTCSIRANDLRVDQSSGTGATRIRLKSPNNTAYWLSVSDAGALVITAV